MSWWQTARRCPGRNGLWVIVAWNLVRGSLGLGLQALYRLRGIGKDLVPREGPIIYVANHQSHFDPVTVGVLVGDRPFAPMARSTLFSFKPFGWAIRFLGAVPVDQNKGDRAALRTMLDELAAGRCILVFPEGARTSDGVMGEFKGGVYLLAKRSGVDVMPIALEGARDIWPRHQRLPGLSGRLLVKAAPPIPSAEFLKDREAEALEKLRRQIEQMRLELRAELRRQTNGSFPPPGVGDQPYWELAAR